MGPRWSSVAVIGAFAVLAVGCRDEPRRSPPPPPRREPPPAAPRTGPPASMERRVFDDGRYAIRWPLPLDFTTTEIDRGTTKAASHGLHEGKAFALLYYVYESPSARIAEDGFIRFATTAFVAALRGRDPVIEPVELPAATSGARVVRFRSAATGRELQHEAVVFVVDRTMVFVHVSAAGDPSNLAVELARSFEVLRARRDIPPRSGEDIMEGAAKLIGPLPEPTAAERRSAPRSRRPGQPSIGTSCYQIVGECYESAVTFEGRGYAATPGQCMRPNRFGEDPCPQAGRLGSCVLRNRDGSGEGAQVIHFYNPREDNQDRCTSLYSGTWHPATPRVLPRNPG